MKQINAHQPFDYLFEDGEHFKIGELEVYNIPPGHTPACLSYVIGDAVFVGDTLFMPDYGTARCDFPNGSASVLYDSVHKLFQLPESTRVFFVMTICQSHVMNINVKRRFSSKTAKRSYP